jgi:hypothetical protein
MEIRKCKGTPMKNGAVRFQICCSQEFYQELVDRAENNGMRRNKLILMELKEKWKLELI